MRRGVKNKFLKPQRLDNFSLQWIKNYDWNQFNFTPWIKHKREFLFGFSNTKSALQEKTKAWLI